MPRFRHHDFEFEVPDDWWNESGMGDPTLFSLGQSFHPGEPEYPNGKVLMLPLVDVCVKPRCLGEFGVFRNREDVVRILKGFRDGDPIPPVEVRHIDGSRYALYHGQHRFYCSVAAGFTHVPAVETKVLEPTQWRSAGGNLTP